MQTTSLQFIPAFIMTGDLRPSGTELCSAVSKYAQHITTEGISSLWNRGNKIY